MKKVIFYPGPMHLFWTTGIYYLNELSKYFEVTLVLEKSNEEDREKINCLTQKRIKNIYLIENANRLRRHWIYKNTATKLTREAKFDYVFVPDDMSPFSLYLLRQAKKKSSINLCYQTGAMMDRKMKCKKLLNNTRAARIKYKFKIPFSFAKFVIGLINLQKHWWHYVIAPILVGRYPFFGDSSCYLYKGRSAMRDGDYFIVFGDGERNICLEDGLEVEKIVVIPHPLTWISNNNLKTKILNLNPRNHDEEEMDIIIFLDDLQYIIDKSLGRIITAKEIFDMWRKIIEIFSIKYPDKTIWIKPHPAQTDENGSMEIIKEITYNNSNVRLVDKNESAMDYLSRCRIIISEVSTILYIASLLFENKIIISLNLCNRYLGDIYKNVKNINYVLSLKDFETFDFNKKEKISLPQYDGGKMLKEFLSSIEN